MAFNLQVEQNLNQAAQSIKDQNGTTSPLSLSTDKVGIGTTQPSHLLHVKGSLPILALQDSDNTGPSQSGYVSLRDNQNSEKGWFGFGSEKNTILGIANNYPDGVVAFRTGGRERMRILEAGLRIEGDIQMTGDVILTGADCAEDFKVEDDEALDPGSVMVIGGEDTLRQCTEAYDRRVTGVLSGAGHYRPGLILDRHQSPEKRMPLALTGKVFCKVDAQYSAIGVGDLLTTSPTPGHAMKASDPLKAFGSVIGKALGALDAGKGLIPILVALQ